MLSTGTRQQHGEIGNGRRPAVNVVLARRRFHVQHISMRERQQRKLERRQLESTGSTRRFVILIRPAAGESGPRPGNVGQVESKRTERGKRVSPVEADERAELANGAAQEVDFTLASRARIYSDTARGGGTRRFRALTLETSLGHAPCRRLVPRGRTGGGPELGADRANGGPVNEGRLRPLGERAAVFRPGDTSARRDPADAGVGADGRADRPTS